MDREKGNSDTEFELVADDAPESKNADPADALPSANNETADHVGGEPLESGAETAEPGSGEPVGSGDETVDHGHGEPLGPNEEAKHDGEPAKPVQEAAKHDADDGEPATSDDQAALHDGEPAKPVQEAAKHDADDGEPATSDEPAKPDEAATKREGESAKPGDNTADAAGPVGDIEADGDAPKKEKAAKSYLKAQTVKIVVPCVLVCIFTILAIVLPLTIGASKPPPSKCKYQLPGGSFDGSKMPAMNFSFTYRDICLNYYPNLQRCLNKNPAYPGASLFNGTIVFDDPIKVSYMPKANSLNASEPLVIARLVVAHSHDPCFLHRANVYVAEVNPAQGCVQDFLQYEMNFQDSLEITNRRRCNRNGFTSPDQAPSDLAYSFYKNPVFMEYDAESDSFEIPLSERFGPFSGDPEKNTKDDLFGFLVAFNMSGPRFLVGPGKPWPNPGLEELVDNDFTLNGAFLDNCVETGVVASHYPNVLKAKIEYIVDPVMPRQNLDKNLRISSVSLHEGPCLAACSNNEKLSPEIIDDCLRKCNADGGASFFNITGNLTGMGTDYANGNLTGGNLTGNSASIKAGFGGDLEAVDSDVLAVFDPADPTNSCNATATWQHLDKDTLAKQAREAFNVSKAKLDRFLTQLNSLNKILGKGEASDPTLDMVLSVAEDVSITSSRMESTLAKFEQPVGTVMNVIFTGNIVNKTLSPIVQGLATGASLVRIVSSVPIIGSIANAISGFLESLADGLTQIAKLFASASLGDSFFYGGCKLMNFVETARSSLVKIQLILDEAIIPIVNGTANAVQKIRNRIEDAVAKVQKVRDAINTAVDGMKDLVGLGKKASDVVAKAENDHRRLVSVNDALNAVKNTAAQLRAFWDSTFATAMNKIKQVLEFTIDVRTPFLKLREKTRLLCMDGIDRLCNFCHVVDTGVKKVKQVFGFIRSLFGRRRRLGPCLDVCRAAEAATCTVASFVVVPIWVNALQPFTVHSFLEWAAVFIKIGAAAFDPSVIMSTVIEPLFRKEIQGLLEKLTPRIVPSVLGNFPSLDISSIKEPLNNALKSKLPVVAELQCVVDDFSRGKVLDGCIMQQLVDEIKVEYSIDVANGARCSADELCQSGFCNQGTCCTRSLANNTQCQTSSKLRRLSMGRGQ